MTSLIDDRDACLAAVEQSPAAVAAHDKSRWVALFAPGAVVEDPVGSRPHHNDAADAVNGPIGRFYETFIAANTIRFHVQHDIVCAGNVLRDLDIEIHMSPRVVVRVPMHLRYQLREVDGALRIAHLAAHWELAPMLRQQMQFGLASMVAGTKAFWRMLRYLGLSGIAGFAEARKTVGEHGKAVVSDAVYAINSGDSEALGRLSMSGATLQWLAADAVGLGEPPQHGVQVGVAVRLGDVAVALVRHVGEVLGLFATALMAPNPVRRSAERPLLAR